MRIKLNSIFVDDQEKALRFYTDVLGFRKKQDFPVGGARWIDGRVARRSGRSRTGAGAERTSGRERLSVRAHEGRHSGNRVRKHVDFTTRCSGSRNAARCSRRSRRLPGTVTLAVFSDTCGNLIQVYQPQTR